VPAPTTILVGHIGKVFWLRVEGRGTFQDSVQVKRAFQTIIAAGTRDLVVDLERCPMMDSTFLGTLTGTALNANPRNQQLLTDLGLDHILDLDIAGTAWPAERREACAQLSTCGEKGAEGKMEQTEHILTAHRTLADVSHENRGRFRDVIHFLERELSGSGPMAASP
jgi:anti-anti-sigma regulatory factor